MRKYKSFICLERLLFCFLSKISIYGIPFLFRFPFLYRLDSGWEYLPHNYCYGRYMHILKVLTFWSIKWLHLHMLKMFISLLYSVALRKKCVDRQESYSAPIVKPVYLLRIKSCARFPLTFFSIFNSVRWKSQMEKNLNMSIYWEINIGNFQFTLFSHCQPDTIAYIYFSLSSKFLFHNVSSLKWFSFHFIL